MNHNCPYFHDESLMPQVVRETLEQRIEAYLNKSGKNTPDPELASVKSSALIHMVDSVLILAEELKDISGGNPDISARISHDLVHNIGHSFSESNESIALEALGELRLYTNSKKPETGWKRISKAGLANERGKRLSTMLQNSSGLRKKALAGELKRENDASLDGYEKNLYRSIIRTSLPRVLEDIIQDSRTLVETGNKIQHYFGFSSKSWDLQNGQWKEIPWDVFDFSRQLLEKDPSIRRLAEILGRGPGRNSGDHRKEITRSTLVPEVLDEDEYLGRSEILGIEFGQDINLLLPAEYSTLSDPETELKFYKELLDAELLISKYRSMQHRKFTRYKSVQQKIRIDEPKGPVIICVDTSGSMAGWPEKVAKALTLAMVKECWREDRPLYLILFSTEIAELDLSDMNEQLLEFSSFFSMEFRGGTDLRPALRRSIQLMTENKFKDADLLIVSDFRVPKIMIKQGKSMETVRRNGSNRIHALTIGAHPIEDSYNLFDSQWHYRLSKTDTPLGVTGLVEI